MAKRIQPERFCLEPYPVNRWQASPSSSEFDGLTACLPSIAADGVWGFGGLGLGFRFCAFSLDRCRARAIDAFQWSMWIRCPMTSLFFDAAFSLDRGRMKANSAFQWCMCVILCVMNIVGCKFRVGVFSLDNGQARAVWGFQWKVWMRCPATSLFLEIALSLDRGRARQFYAIQWGVCFLCLMNRLMTKPQEATR